MDGKTVYEGACGIRVIAGMDGQVRRTVFIETA